VTQRAGDPAGPDRLDLADWRRRVSDRYALVRAEAPREPERAWQRWRATREELFRTHPQSPVPANARAGFRASHWPYDPRYRFEATLASEAAAASQGDIGEALGMPEPITGGFALAGPIPGGFTLRLPISTGGEEGFTRIGWLDAPFPDGSRSLGLYWMAGYAGGLFLPFRDATNGSETYGAGRYLLDTAKSADLGSGAAPQALILDFNFAFHPSCAFDPKWACPLAPPENRLDLRIEAGERLA
jgi:hypothetical protein